jgi:hypothetical protein
MKKANEQTIKNAFARLMADKDEIIRRGMYSLLEEAVKFALEIHDESHQTHIEIGDTYGWMLVHDHKIEEIVTVATADNRGKATKALRSKLSKLPAKGWVGVVMAGLKPANYFSVTYEVGIINNTADMTRQKFSQYFTRI